MAHMRRKNNWQDHSENRYDPDTPHNSRAGAAVQRHAQPHLAHSQDWDNLRNELEDLLDQVHFHQHDTHQHDTHQHDTAMNPQQFQTPERGHTSPYTEHYQPSSSNPYDRHQQALMSVQRAVERSNEPEEAFTMPAQSQHQLQNAVRQIRSSQRTRVAGERHNYHMPNPKPAQFQSAQLDEFGTALKDISARLENFEHAIGNNQSSDSAVLDMAQQVEQLSGVVEHLANNIGERGQIRRLETQITEMANAIPDSSELDFQSLNTRLDTLFGAFKQLQDLQAQQVALNIEANNDDTHMGAIEAGVRNIYERLDSLDLSKVSLEPIETCVRTIYDRIDTLEKTMAVPPPAIDRLTQEMADFTQAMRDNSNTKVSQNLIGQAELLINRIEQIEIESGSVGALKFDMEDLQASVLGAMEPKFAAIESQIGNLAEQANVTNQGSGKYSTSLNALEKNIQALTIKMDNTSTELSNLQDMLVQNTNTPDTDTPAFPDLETIADLLAKRTSQAMEQIQSQSDNGLEKGDLEQLENRLAMLFQQGTHKENPSQNSHELNGVQNSINQVNNRLARLEATLSAQDALARERDGLPNDARHTNTPHGTVSTPEHATPEDTHPPQSNNTLSEEAEKLADANWEPPQHLIPALRDNMPRPPAQDTPLNSPAFGRADISGIQALKHNPLEVDLDDLDDLDDLEVVQNEAVDNNQLPQATSGTHSAAPSRQDPIKSARKESARSKSETGRIKLPSFMDKDIAPPPAPVSSFASPSDTLPQGAFDKNPERKRANQSTFIEAARRAAQANQANKIDADNGETQSLIGRAMARFQKRRAEPKQNESNEQTSHQSAPKRPVLPGDAPSDKQNDKASSQNTNDLNDVQFDDLEAIEESFLTRHRQPILLVAAVVAIGFLTLNLINQRSGESPSSQDSVSSVVLTSGNQNEASPTSNSSASPDIDADAKNSAALISDQSVGSIEPNSDTENGDVRIIDPSLSSEMPATLNMASLNSVTDGDTSVGVEMPPEAIGPLLLRQTAANGDPRAQFEIAAIFAEGRAIPQDLEAAAKWYERAAAQNFAPAAYRLANMLENGIGMEADLFRARLWYQLAADAGNRMSMHNLASLLAGGQLGEQQFDAAAHWFEQAAALGLKDSQFNLGMLHARGLGVPQNLEASFKWFSIAASLGDEDAAKARDDIARSLDADIVINLQNELAGWAPASMDIPANFAPIGTWSNEFDPGPTIEKPDVIMHVQAALNGLGFNTGIPDGLMGPKTIDAISAFETQTGMPPSGKINPRLLAVLGSQPV